MTSGLFILLADENSLLNCINNGIYGFLMPPIFKDVPSAQSRHFAVLADYACCDKGTEVFFFSKRHITYGGRITADNGENPVFYLNGNTSPLGRKANSEMYVDMSKLYKTTDKKGVYDLGFNQRGEPRPRAMSFIIEFENNELTGKQIMSDELYFELGNYNYPFPSNSIQDKGFCTLTLKETNILLDLIKQSNEKIEFPPDYKNKTIIDENKKKLFNTSLLEDDTKLVNEHHLEFKLLANKNKLDNILEKCIPNYNGNDYLRCRQIPLCPFRPIQFDAADICLYSKSNPVKDYTLPNIVIELKKDKASIDAYRQVTKYLRWIKQIAPDEFDKVNAVIIARDFTNNFNRKNFEKKGINLEYKDKITAFSLDKNRIIHI